MSNLDLDTLVTGRRVALVGTADETLPQRIQDAGAADVLCLSPNGPAKPLRDGNLIHGPYRRYRDAGRNNAEVLFLAGTAPMAARRFKSIGHARYLCIPQSVDFLAFLPGLLRYAPRSALARIGKVSINDANQRRKKWIVYENRHQKFTRGPRYWADVSLKAEELFEKLKGLNYTLLRWPDQLDNMDQLQDLDLLVADADLPQLVERLDQRIGLRPVDVYTVNGHGGHGSHGIAYFPPAAARDLLENSTACNRGIRQPLPRHALLCFAYHLMFHKGPRCVPGEMAIGPDTWASPHYEQELQRLAQAAGVSALQTMEQVESLLQKAGWMPPRDTISVYAKQCEWLNSRYFAEQEKLPPGLAVFLIREIAERHGLISDIESMIAQAGFEPVSSGPIPSSQRGEVASATRGGNWDTPNDREAVGGPVHAIISYDPHPRPLRSPKAKKRYPRVDNRHLLKKCDLRTEIARRLDMANCNVLHASDNTQEALDYVRLIAPEAIPGCLDRLGVTADAA